MTPRSSLSCSSNPPRKSLPVNLIHFGDREIATISVNTRVDKMGRKAFHVAQTARSRCRALRGAGGVTERPTMALELLQTKVFGHRHNIEVATAGRRPLPYWCFRGAPNSRCAHLMHRGDRLPSADRRTALSGATEAVESQGPRVGALSRPSANPHDRVDFPVPCKKLLQISARGTCFKIAMPRNAAD
jgi:hypothetical protein